MTIFFQMEYLSFTDISSCFGVMLLCKLFCPLPLFFVSRDLRVNLKPCVVCIEATVCPSPAPAAASPQNWRQKAAFTQRSRPGGGPGLLIPSPQPGLQEPQQCPHELCKASYSPMSPCWDTKVTCSMASRTASRRFLEWGCLRKACPICSGKTVCRNYTPAGEKPAVAMTEYGFIFIHLSKTNHHSM